MRAKENQPTGVKWFFSASIVWKPQSKCEEGAGERGWGNGKATNSAALLRLTGLLLTACSLRVAASFCFLYLRRGLLPGHRPEIYDDGKAVKTFSDSAACNKGIYL